MSHRHSALAIAAVVIGSALAGAAFRPGTADAQVYDEGGQRPFGFHTHEDLEFDPGRGRVDHRREADGGSLAYQHHRPADFDGRDRDLSIYGSRRWHRGYDERRWDRDDDHRGYGARFDAPYGPGFPDRPYGVYPLGADPYEEVVVPVAPPAEEFQGPDVGCTIRRSESITAAGWRKIVSHKICYRR